MKNSQIIIGIDLTKFNGRMDLGIGRYIDGLMQGFATHSPFSCGIIIFTDQNILIDSNARFPSSETIPVQIRHSFFIKILLAFAFLLSSSKLLSLVRNFQYKKVSAVIENRVDCLYTPTTYLNFKTKFIPTLVSIHDIQHYSLPNNFKFLERMRRRLNTRFTINEASLIQVSSDFVAAEILQFFPHKTEKSLIKIPEGINKDTFHFQDKKYSKEIKIFMPAFAWHHKNHNLLFRAVEMLPRQTQIKVYLTVTKEDILSLDIDLPIRNLDMLVFLGRISTEDLEVLFQETNYLLSCSLYESSSLPILEGIACGNAILASSIPAHLEMAREYEIQLFDPLDHTDLLRTLLSLEASDFGVTARNNYALDSVEWALIAKMYIDCLVKLEQSI